MHRFCRLLSFFAAFGSLNTAPNAVILRPCGIQTEDFANFFVTRLAEQRPVDRKRLESNLEVACKSSTPILYGCGCSGIDALQNWFPALLSSLAKQSSEFADLMLKYYPSDFFREVFQCENNEKKIKFQAEHDMISSVDGFAGRGTHLFKDITKMGHGKAVCTIVGLVDIPWARLFVAGFTCKTVSMLNKNHQLKKNCVKKKEGDTGKTFAGCKAYIKSHLSDNYYHDSTS